MKAPLVQSPLPLGHHYGRYRVTDEIRWGQPSGHQTVNAKDKCHTLNRDRAIGGESSCQHNECRARDPGRSLRRKQ
jgi:hypothetical protein